MNDTPITTEPHPRKWWECMAGATAVDRRNNLRFAVWTLLWGVGLTAVTQYIRRSPDLDGPGIWALALVPAFLALMALRACLRFLRETDELVRRIHRDGMAVGFGTVVMFAMTYAVLEDLGASVMGLEEALVVAICGYGVGALIGTWRYR